LKNTTLLSILRIVALVVLLAGAWESLHYALLASRNNNSWFLRALFAAWVLLPFAALLTAGVVSHNWATKNRTTTYVLMLLISAGSYMAYSGMFSPPDTEAAGSFVLVPLASLLLLMIVIPLSAFLAHKDEGAA
jgi:hypothetical protein